MTLYCWKVKSTNFSSARFYGLITNRKSANICWVLWLHEKCFGIAQRRSIPQCEHSQPNWHAFWNHNCSAKKLGEKNSFRIGSASILPKRLMYPKWISWIDWKEREGRRMGVEQKEDTQKSDTDITKVT